MSRTRQTDKSSLSKLPTKSASFNLRTSDSEFTTDKLKASAHPLAGVCLTMAQQTNDRNPVGSRLLATLPRKEYERLIPHLETVHLAKGEVIYHPGDNVRHVYFPAGAVVSLISMTQDGNTIEVALVGDEGIVGVSAVLGARRTPYMAITQVGGEALRVKAETLREEVQQSQTLQDLLLCYVHLMLTQVIQSAVCNHFHSATERLCRWLLLTSDRAKTDNLPLTQEFISHMLGTPRTSVTAIAKELQDAGLISYSRGQITLLDRAGLESAACECYQVLNRAFSSLIKP